MTQDTYFTHEPLTYPAIHPDGTVRDIMLTAFMLLARQGMAVQVMLHVHGITVRGIIGTLDAYLAGLGAQISTIVEGQETPEARATWEQTFQAFNAEPDPPRMPEYILLYSVEIVLPNGDIQHRAWWRGLITSIDGWSLEDQLVVTQQPEQTQKQ